MRRILALILILQWVACASPKPVLYPNAHLEDVGEKVSQEDIDACLALADAADLESNQAAEAAKVGLGVGSVAGFFSWMFGSKKPEPVYVNYVNICLSERGYQTVGWK